MMPHEADGALHVLQWCVVFFEILPAWHAVLEHHPGHSDGIQPSRHLRTLMLDGQYVVPPAGTNHHRCSCVLRRVRLVNR